MPSFPLFRDVSDPQQLFKNFVHNGHVMWNFLKTQNHGFNKNLHKNINKLWRVSSSQMVPVWHYYLIILAHGWSQSLCSHCACTITDLFLTKRAGSRITNSTPQNISMLPWGTPSKDSYLQKKIWERKTKHKHCLMVQESLFTQCCISEAAQVNWPSSCLSCICFPLIHLHSLSSTLTD